VNLKVELMPGKLAEGRSGEWNNCSGVIMACFAGYFFVISDK
jgi:hypothetical protein